MTIADQARFAPGTVTYTQTAKSAVQRTGLTLGGCLRRHLTGDFGNISGELAMANTQVLDAGRQDTPLHDDVESRYGLPDGRELVFITHDVHTPDLRWTDICLVEELVDGRPTADTEEIELDLDGTAVREIIEAADAVDLTETVNLALDDDARITVAGVPSAGLIETTVLLGSLRPGPWQPRRHFDRERLGELAASIRQDGLLNPPLLAPDHNHYAIIAGERRWRALCALTAVGSGAITLAEALDVAAGEDGPTQLLQRWGHLLAEVEIAARLDSGNDPARRQRLALIDNIQRQDLDPIEEAWGYLALKQEYDYTNRQVAERVGRSTAHVAGRLALFNLEEPIRALIAAGDFPRSPEVAKAVLSLPTAEARIKFARHHAERRTANTLIIKAADVLRHKLKERDNSIAGPPMPALGLQRQAASDPTKTVPAVALRQAAYQMCGNCPIKTDEMAAIPEPAWALIRLEAAFVCSQCPLQHVTQVCRECPGVALLQALAGVEEVA